MRLPLAPYASAVAVFNVLLFSGDAFASQVQVDLSSYLNNKAAALDGYMASFDGHNDSYPAEYLPTGFIVDASINYTLPDFTSPYLTTFDNVNCSAQTIPVPAGKYHSFNWLGATDGGSTINGQFYAIYEDGTNETLGFVVAPWWLANPSDGPVSAPYLNEGLSNGTTFKNYNATRMFSFQHHLDNAKTLTSIILANETGSSETTGIISIHMFSMTLVAVNTNATTESGPVLNVQNTRSTTKFRTLNETQVQLMEITLNNFAPSTADPSSWITNPTTFTLSSSSIRTVLPGTVQRLRGGDQVRVIVGVLNTNNVTAGTQVSDVVVLVDGKQVGGKWSVTAGIPDYVEGDESLMTHESPEWFDGAKFGLFVHWGIYSVPSWTVSGTQYAEWYWYWQHNPANSSSAVWTHHKEVYGEDFLYDDFFPNFTASAFDAKEFVKFVADIGAKYYVLTTKHHDGFALFDTGNSSNRNSLNYGPKRDLVAEIVAAAKETQPQLHNGLYFSLPEWFNPSFAKYGHADAGDDLYHRRSTVPGTPGYDILQRTGWAGGLAHNAYNWSAPLEPYTGYVEVDDFLVDIMKPQMEALFYNYDADILWCDVGGPTIFQEIAPAWFNTAKEAGRQVTYNARCGANYSDFDNPEYSSTNSLKLRKWESSEGSDPYSYGFNQDTPWSNYQNSSYILHSLIDIVSKNGNYLIDIGPMANGTIVEPSATSLLEVGQWLQIAGDAIYDTQYWFVAAEDDASDLRFTTKSDAFYIISLTYPTNGTIRTSLPLPVKDGDTVTFLGNTTTTTNSSTNSTTINGRGEEKKGVEWHWAGEGVFELFADEEALKKVANAWAFKVEYK